MKKVLRGLLMAAAVVFLAVLLGTLIPRPFSSRGAESHADRQILILSSAIHTDIAIPLDAAARETFGFMAADGMPIFHPEARWIVFGWGGRSFYTETPSWSELKPVPVLKALTVDSSVMHVEIAGQIRLPHPAITPVNISRAGLDQLSDFVAASFVEDVAGRPAVLANAGYGRDDRFYEAHGYFNALLGCNTWTGGALRAAGLTTGTWTPLPYLLTLSLWLHGNRD